MQRINTCLMFMLIRQLNVFEIYFIKPYICKQANVTAFRMLFSSQPEELFSETVRQLTR